VTIFEVEVCFGGAGLGEPLGLGEALGLVLALGAAAAAGGEGKSSGTGAKLLLDDSPESPRNNIREALAFGETNFCLSFETPDGDGGGLEPSP
jgi:hypothetical protein